jgi:putative CocE/NonD family hydrolase
MQNTGPHTLPEGPTDNSFEKALWHLPLMNMQQLLGRNAQFYRDWIEHPNYDDYWKKLNAEEVFDQIAIPAYNAGGWFDIFSDGTLKGYTGMASRGKTETARKQTRLIIGPWGHGSTQKTGDIDFGKHAHVDWKGIQLRYFDYWLKGEQNGIDRDPPVSLFTMGINEWRQENEYPLARTQYRKMYLASQGKANSNRGDGLLTWDEPAAASKPDVYRYDPDNPVPSVGGNNCCGTPTAAGPRDQRSIESRQDILVYTSDYLKDDLEVTGPVKVVVYASSDAPDTDFVAKLIDVYPDGHAYNMAEGIVRARYRESLSAPKMMEAGKVYPFTIDLVGTSNVFRKGHRIRVDLTSSHFPQFDRNPNTGEPFGVNANVRVATQTVHHTKQYASHVLLPVIP